MFLVVIVVDRIQDESRPGEALPIRRVSVVAPMYNEAAHIEQFVADLADQDLVRDLEILVADGGSQDGCAALLRSAADRLRLAVTVVDNPARAVAPGLNECIRRSSGELVVRLDCHTRYPSDYLSACVAASEESGAWNVGGVLTPEGRTRRERAVACAMDSPFGGIIWSRHLASGDRVEVDTVPYGAFRREVFDAAGLFDETLVRNQDDEFNARLRAAGGRVVLDPRIQLRYVPRGSLRGVARQYYEYGLWKVPVMLKHRRVLGARSLAPIALVGSVLGLAAAAPWGRTARAALALEVGAYVGCAACFGFRAIARRDESPSLLPEVMAVFPAFHVGYGIGMCHGWIRAATGR